MSSRVSRSALRKHNQNAMTVKVALLGLNRITGSLGLALRSINERPTTKVVFSVLGRDEDNEAMKAAHRLGAIDNFNRTLQTVVEEADIVFVNVPMGDLDELYARLGSMLKSGAVVIDLSPLKTLSVKLAEKYFPKGTDGKSSIYLVGATPLIGFEQLYGTDNSVEGSQEFLFRNSDILIAPHASTPPEAVKVVTDIADFLNMKPRFMDPSEYDGLASLAESIPMLLSVLLFQTVQRSPGKIDILRATNATFASAVQNLRYVNEKDISTLWQSNKTSLLQQLEQITQNLETLHQLITDQDPMMLESFLKQILDGFVSWEVRREDNKWDTPDTSVLDDVQVGIPVIGQPFNLRRRSRDETSQ